VRSRKRSIMMRPLHIRMDTALLPVSEHERNRNITREGVLRLKAARAGADRRTR